MSRYAVVYYVTYEAIEGKWARWMGSTREKKLSHLGVKALYFTNRCIWVVISGLLALEVPHFGDFLGLIGALGTSLAVYILPQVPLPPTPPPISLLAQMGCPRRRQSPGLCSTEPCSSTPAVV